MRTRTDHFARSTDCWTSDCLAAARRQANEMTRPQGHFGPTPSELWSGCGSISQSQRDQLQTAILLDQRQIVADMRQFNPQNRNHKHKVLRQALRRVLLDLGLLTITRRSIPLPPKPKNWARIP